MAYSFDRLNTSVIYGLCAMRANRPLQHPSWATRNDIVAVVSPADGRKWGIKKPAMQALFFAAMGSTL